MRQYYHWVPAKDLADREPADLCGAVVAHWRLAQQRQRREAKVNVYNPDSERDGWSSPYTVVEIVSDDMPFIVDSVTMELSRQGNPIELIIHPVMRVVRSGDGELTEVLEPGGMAFGFETESVIHAEVARQADPERLAVLSAGIELVLEEVRAAVEDWAEMRARTTALATELRREAPPADLHQLAEAQAFLALARRRALHLPRLPRVRAATTSESSAELHAVQGSGLGILRGSPGHAGHAAGGQGTRPGPLARAAGPDQGQLTRHRSSPVVPGLRRRQAVCSRWTGGRRAPLPRPLHHHRLQDQPATDTAVARQGGAGAGACCVPA